MGITFTDTIPAQKEVGPDKITEEWTPPKELKVRRSPASPHSVSGSIPGTRRRQTTPWQRQLLRAAFERGSLPAKESTP